MGGEYLVWKGKENFHAFCDFHGVRVIDLAVCNYSFANRIDILY